MKTRVKIEKIPEGSGKRWDNLLDKSGHSQAFHLWSWVSSMAEHSWLSHSGFKSKPKFHPLIATMNGEDLGLIPLYEFRLGLIKYVFSPPPNTGVTYLGPVIRDMDVRQKEREKIQGAFHEAIEEYLNKLHPHIIRIRTPPGFTDARPYLWSGYEVTPVYNYVNDLTVGIEQLRGGYGKNRRKKLRNTVNKGYSVREGNLDDVISLYKHHTERYEEQGMHMNLSLDYLKELWSKLGGSHLKIHVIELEGKYVSSHISTIYDKKISAWYGMHKTDGFPASPNEQLMDTTLEWAIKNKLEVFENIWANNERLNPFKTNTNPGLNEYYSCITDRGIAKPLKNLKNIFTQKGGLEW